MKKLVFGSITFLSAAILLGCDKAEDKSELPDSCKNIITQSKVTFPTAFTPNGDGRNDGSRVLGMNKSQWTDFTFTIYKLNGDIAFQTSDLNAAWDGRINGNLSTDRLYRVTIKFTLNGEVNDLCTYLYSLPSNGSCIDASGVDINLLRFEDQYDASSGIFVFVTGEQLC